MGAISIGEIIGASCIHNSTEQNIDIDSFGDLCWVKRDTVQG